MLGRILVAGIIGAIVLFVWIMLSNGVFGFYGRLAMKQVQNEEALHDILSEYVTEPGGYVVNPKLGEGGFPLEEPVYGLRYCGSGHEAAGRMFFVDILTAFLVSALAAWLRPGTQAELSS